MLYKKVVWLRRAGAQKCEDCNAKPGGIVGIDLETGKVACEIYAEVNSIGYQVAADNKLFFHKDGNHSEHPTLVLTADTSDFRLLGTISGVGHNTSYEITSFKPISRGRMIARGYEGLYCYDVSADASSVRQPTQKAMNAASETSSRSTHHVCYDIRGRRINTSSTRFEQRKSTAVLIHQTNKTIVRTIAFP